MTISEFYAEVARKADTDTTKISAAETSRVLSEAFKVLAAMSPAESFDIVSKCMTNAASKAAG